jgi:hypothetical protein
MISFLPLKKPEKRRGGKINNYITISIEFV